MISEDRIRSMTKLAVFEEGRGKKAISRSTYPASDYRALQFIKFFVLGTLAFLIVVVGYYYLQFLDGKMDMTTDYLLAEASRALIAYVVFMIVYLLCTIHVAMRRYYRAKLETREYKKQLHSLSQLYEWERRVKKEGTLTHMNLWNPEETEENNDDNT